jgi:hypothetical protein
MQHHALHCYAKGSVLRRLQCEVAHDIEDLHQASGAL